MAKEAETRAVKTEGIEWGSGISGCIPPVVRQDPSDCLYCVSLSPAAKWGVSLLISGPSYLCSSWILCALSHGVMFLSTTWDVLGGRAVASEGS